MIFQTVVSRGMVGAAVFLCNREIVQNPDGGSGTLFQNLENREVILNSSKGQTKELKKRCGRKNKKAQTVWYSKSIKQIALLNKQKLEVEIMMYAKVIVKLPILIPRALAGDPTAIAILAAAGISAAAYYIKENC